MDAANCELAYGLVSRSYISQGQQSLNARHARVKSLLSSRRLPQEGWDEATIEMFIQDLAAMDSNNFLGNVGVGEREARVACPLVARRYWNLAHGIGRSGDIAAEQPKAAGSSLISKLCNILVADALHIAGLTELKAVTVLPLATGMAMTVTLLALRPHRGRDAKYVVWSRIDQKTCLKCILAANLEPLVVPLVQNGEELQTNVEGIIKEVERVGPEQVVCVITTTSCFAPRGSDDVVSVAKACASLQLPHIINNAYGVQSAQLCKIVSSACRKGRVDAVIQSSDKNFMVPVGGAIVASPGVNTPLKLVDAVNQLYPGRAAASAHLDLLLTLLHWGESGWKKVLADREDLYPYLKQRLEETAEQLGEKVLNTPSNPISVALSLDGLAAATSASRPSLPFKREVPLVPTDSSVLPGNSCDHHEGRRSTGGARSTGKGHQSTREGSVTDTTRAAEGVKDRDAQDASQTAEAMQLNHLDSSAVLQEDGRTPTGPSAQLISAAAAATAITASGAASAATRTIPSHAVAASAASTGQLVASIAGARDEPSGSTTEAPMPSVANDKHEGPTCAKKAVDLTMLGSMLWSRFVSGTRVVTGTKQQKVAGITFQGYGAHHDAYPHQYLTVAAALGTTKKDVDDFCKRLVKCYQEFKRKHSSS